jgi:hypothetical protein
MFETSEEIRRLTDEVYALTEDLTRGDTLTHEAIKNVLYVEPHEGAWDHVVNRARRRLQDARGIATWPDVTVGYRLLTTSEQLVDLPRWRDLKASRQHRRALRSLVALPERGLSRGQRRTRAMLIQAEREHLRHLGRELRERAILAAPSRVTPRRPDPAAGGRQP